MSWGDGDRSASRREFRAWFGSDEACLDYLEWLRSRQAPADARTHAKFGATSRESPVENGPRGTTPVKWIPQNSAYRPVLGSVTQLRSSLRFLANQIVVHEVYVIALLATDKSLALQ